MTFLSILLSSIVVMSVLVTIPPKASGYDRSYRNYHLYRLQIVRRRSGKLLKQLESDQRFDVWSHPSTMSPYADVMVSPLTRKQFLHRLKRRHILHWLISSDVQQMIDAADEETMSSRRRRRHRRSGNVNVQNKYNSYTNMVKWMEAMARKHPAFVSTFVIGESFYRQNIVGIKVGYPSATNKSSIWVDGGIHAREWIAPAAAIFAAHTLIRDVGSTETRSLLEKFDFLIIPVVNPDGYEHSRMHNRLWRKTRSQHPRNPACQESSWTGFVSSCRGVDANRNFGFHWGEEGSFQCRPCGNIYAGPTAFSENETRAIRDYTRTLSRLRVFISLHSYGQVWLTAWGYTMRQPSNYPQQKVVAEAVIKVVREHSGNNYTFGSISNQMYPASGTSIDYMQNAGIEYVYAIELPPTDNPRSHGFLYPPRYIASVGDELYVALKELARQIHRRDTMPTATPRSF